MISDKRREELTFRITYFSKLLENYDEYSKKPTKREERLLEMYRRFNPKAITHLIRRYKEQL